MDNKNRDREDFTAVRIDRLRLERLRKIAERDDRSIAAVLRRMIDKQLEGEKAEA